MLSVYVQNMHITPLWIGWSDHLEFKSCLTLHRLQTEGVGRIVGSALRVFKEEYNLKKGIKALE